jgi:hypothetical protein
MTIDQLWAIKTKFIKHANNQEYEEFYKIVLENIEHADIQFFDMVIECIDVTTVNLKFWESIEPYYTDEVLSKLGFKSNIRIEFIRTLIKDQNNGKRK